MNPHGENLMMNSTLTKYSTNNLIVDKFPKVLFNTTLQFYTMMVFMHKEKGVQCFGNGVVVGIARYDDTIGRHDLLSQFGI